MHKWHQAQRYAHHWLYEINEHSLHEPFAYALYTNVVVPNRKKIVSNEIERIRSTYRNRTEPVTLTSPGAKSTFRKRSLHQIAFQGSTSPRHARILASLVSHTRAKNLLELGTSLGFTSMYLSTSIETKLITLEGEPSLYEEAKRNLGDRKNVHVIPGNIDSTLDEALERIGEVDFAYFDANHRYEPTLNYYKKVLPRCHPRSVLVFDDIHWSTEMSRAWHKIQQDPRVSLTMDFFHMGWVFFQPLERKYHYILSLN